MSWTLRAWQQVNARLEHALHALPNEDARFAFAWQTAQSAVAPDSGLSAMEALAWALNCLGRDLASPRLAADEFAMVVNLAAGCLGLGEVAEFDHPLSSLHADLLEIRSRYAMHRGQRFVAHWRFLQARQIRAHANGRSDSTYPVASLISLPKRLHAFEAPPRGAKYPLENILWSLARRHPEAAGRRTSLSSSQDPDTTPLSHFVRDLQRYHASDQRMGSAVENMCDFLATVTESVPLNVALLVWAAAARVFEGKSLPDFAALCREHYCELSRGLSEGRSSDLLQLNLCS